MPELPDVTLYVDALTERVVGEPIEKIRLWSPFVLRSVDPPLSEATGRRVEGVSRLGKRIVLQLEGDRHVVIHLMVAGRLRWKPKATKANRKRTLAVFEFSEGNLHFTEASSKKRASIHYVRSGQLAEHDRGGLEVLDLDLASFAERVRSENHTLKRTLTDPRLFSGIGNAYSDEILMQPS